LQNLYILHDTSFDEELRRAAIYLTDRKVIFNLVEAAHYRIKKEVRTGDSSWQILKKAVNLASAGDTIYINGHIISTSAANNSGEIEVREDINIQGLTGKAVDIIDADSKHRIFEVKENKSLTLRNITLQKGKVSAKQESVKAEQAYSQKRKEAIAAKAQATEAPAESSSEETANETEA